jgi:hypothetical protein
MNWAGSLMSLCQSMIRLSQSMSPLELSSL